MSFKRRARRNLSPPPRAAERELTGDAAISVLCVMPCGSCKGTTSSWREFTPTDPDLPKPLPVHPLGEPWRYFTICPHCKAPRLLGAVMHGSL